MCFDGRSRRRGCASVMTWSFTRWRRRWRRSSSTITGWSSGPAGLTRSPPTCCRTTSAAQTSHEQLDSWSSSGLSTGRYYSSRISCWLDYRKDMRPVWNPAPQIGKVNSLATRPNLEHHCQFCGFPPVGLYWDRFMRKFGMPQVAFFSWLRCIFLKCWDMAIHVIVLPANKAYLPLFPSHSASLPFGCYSFYHPTRGRAAAGTRVPVGYPGNKLPG